MRDPKPENITGSKAHTVNWEIDVGHMSIALAALILAYVLWTGLKDDEDDAEVL